MYAFGDNENVRKILNAKEDEFVLLMRIFNKDDLKMDQSSMNDILNALSENENILRSKGIVKASDNDKWYYFDFVSGDYEVRLGSPDVSGRLCVIGSKIDVESIEKLFNV